MEERIEEVLGLTQRLPLHCTQAMHFLHQGCEVLLERNRGKTHDESLDVFLVDAGLIDGVFRKHLPRWTVEKRQFMDRSKPAISAAETCEFYFVPSSVRKSVCTLVRQLRGPHLSTCA
jgi:hypothetical protein